MSAGVQQRHAIAESYIHGAKSNCPLSLPTVHWLLFTLCPLGPGKPGRIVLQDSVVQPLNLPPAKSRHVLFALICLILLNRHYGLSPPIDESSNQADVPGWWWEFAARMKLAISCRLKQPEMYLNVSRHFHRLPILGSWLKPPLPDRFYRFLI